MRHLSKVNRPSWNIFFLLVVKTVIYANCWRLVWVFSSTCDPAVVLLRQFSFFHIFKGMSLIYPLNNVGYHTHKGSKTSIYPQLLWILQFAMKQVTWNARKRKKKDPGGFSRWCMVFFGAQFVLAALWTCHSPAFFLLLLPSVPLAFSLLFFKKWFQGYTSSTLWHPVFVRTDYIRTVKEESVGRDTNGCPKTFGGETLNLFNI